MTAKASQSYTPFFVLILIKCHQKLFCKLSLKQFFNWLNLLIPENSKINLDLFQLKGKNCNE